MTFHRNSVVLGAGALIFTLAMLAIAAGVHVSAQNTNPGPPPFRGRGAMGPGGHFAPGGPGLGPLEERFGFSAARDLTDGEPMHGDPGIRYRFGDRVADAARRIVIFHGNHMAAGRARRGDESVAIDRRHRVEVDHAD